MIDLSPIKAFLGCETPQAWLDEALKHPQILLVDHANCEKKAASTAMNLIYKYIDKPDLLYKLSRLAREELRHFEQVLSFIQKRDIEYVPVSASKTTTRWFLYPSATNSSLLAGSTRMPVGPARFNGSLFDVASRSPIRMRGVPSRVNRTSWEGSRWLPTHTVS